MAEKKEGTVIVATVPCPRCGERGEVRVQEEQWRRYANGTGVQDAFPYLSWKSREQIESGAHPSCYDKMVFDHRERENQIKLVWALGRTNRPLAVRIVNAMRREGYDSLEAAWDGIGPAGILEWRGIGTGALSVIGRTIAALRAPVGNSCEWCGMEFQGGTGVNSPAYHECTCDSRPGNLL